MTTIRALLTLQNFRPLHIGYLFYPMLSPMKFFITGKLLSLSLSLSLSARARRASRRVFVKETTLGAKTDMKLKNSKEPDPFDGKTADR